MTLGEYNKYKKKNKYRNVKIELNGIKFDSKAEARRYKELKLLERAGEITNLELQPKFNLQGSFKKNGKTYRAINYIADFKYLDKKGKEVVEDVKGIETKEFKIKKKMFEFKYKELELKIIK